MRPSKFFIFYFLVFFLTSTFVSASSAIKEGSVYNIYNYSSEDLNFKALSFKKYKGKVLVLNFWATWCPSCIKEMPLLSNMQKKLGSNYVVFAINVEESKALVKRYVSKYFKDRVDLPFLSDVRGELFRSLNLKYLPSTLLIDSNGFVKEIVIGEQEWDNDGIVEYIKGLSAK